MKNILFFLGMLSLVNSITAQKLANTKWYEYYLGGKKGFFTKTHTISQKSLTINQTGSGGNFDNKPSVLPIQFVSTATDERLITKYDDTTYMVILVKNITPMKAKACVNLEKFKNIEAATNYTPNESEYTTWYTEAGFKVENTKPAMPPITKNAMLDFCAFLVEKLKEKEKNLDASKTLKDDKEFALAMSMIAVPFQYAEVKGYNAYKSLAVFEKGIVKFKKDAAVIKIFKDAGFDNLLLK
jgi:hypothetical protein